MALGPVARRALGPWARGPWPLGPGPWVVGPWPLGPWPLGPWALGPRAQGVLVLKTGEADRPKCAFPRPLVVAIVAIAIVAIFAIVVIGLHEKPKTGSAGKEMIVWVVHPYIFHTKKID